MSTPQEADVWGFEVPVKEEGMTPDEIARELRCAANQLIPIPDRAHAACFDIVTKLGALAHRGHTYCEDTWYSCPKHEDGCSNDAEGTECNCGVDEHNAEVDALLAAYDKQMGAAQ